MPEPFSILRILARDTHMGGTACIAPCTHAVACTDKAHKLLKCTYVGSGTYVCEHSDFQLCTLFPDQSQLFNELMGMLLAQFPELKDQGGCHVTGGRTPDREFAPTQFMQFVITDFHAGDPCAEGSNNCDVPWLHARCRFSEQIGLCVCEHAPITFSSEIVGREFLGTITERALQLFPERVCSQH